MQHRVRARIAVTAVALAVLAAGCQWSVRGGPGLTRYSEGVEAISAGNAATLAPVRRTNGLYSIVLDGRHLIGRSRDSADGTGIEVYDAQGRDGCTPDGGMQTCTPLWSTTSGPFTDGRSGPIGVAADRVVTVRGAATDPYVGRQHLAAYDLAGVERCTGTPVVCAPVWVSRGGPTMPGVLDATLAGTRVYGWGTFASDTYRLAVYDSAGVEGCTTVVPRTCAPLWTGSGPMLGRPAVDGGYVYVPAGGHVDVYDAGGVQGCSGTPVVCQPLWRTTSVRPGELEVVVGQGQLVVVPLHGTTWVEVFDAQPHAGCTGTTPVCGPRWRTAGGDDRLHVALAPGTLLIGHADGATGSMLDAYDLSAGPTCSGDPVPTCVRRWRRAVPPVAGFAIGTKPAVANGMVFSCELRNVGGTSVVVLDLDDGSQIAAVPGPHGCDDVAVAAGRVVASASGESWVIARS